MDVIDVTEMGNSLIEQAKIEAIDKGEAEGPTKDHVASKVKTESLILEGRQYPEGKEDYLQQKCQREKGKYLQKSYANLHPKSAKMIYVSHLKKILNHQ